MRNKREAVDSDYMDIFAKPDYAIEEPADPSDQFAVGVSILVISFLVRGKGVCSPINRDSRRSGTN